jgi:hypothetical protein
MEQDDSAQATATEGRGDMHANIKPQNVEAPSSSGVQKRRQGMVAAAQLMLLLALGVTVFVVLLVDSRLYHGIDLDGQPIYRECQTGPTSVLEVNSSSSRNRDGNRDSIESHAVLEAAFLDETVLERHRAAAHG